MTKVRPISGWTADGDNYHIVGGKSYVKEDGCYWIRLKRRDTNLLEDWRLPAKIEGRDLDVDALVEVLGGPWPEGVGPHGKLKFEWNGPWGREFLRKYGTLVFTSRLPIYR